MTTTAQPTAEVRAMPAAEYHAHSALSHSRLDVFIEDPALYEGRFITGEFPEERKTCYDFGTLVHDAVLQGGVECVITIIPRDVLSKSGARSGGAWEAFAAEHAGQYLLKPDEAADVRRAVDAVWKHPKARAILEFPGDCEQSLFWTDEETGLDLRARLDKLTPVLISDLKTTTSTESRRFARSMIDFGYARQAAMYQDAALAITGETLTFVFIAVRKDPPFSVETFVPDDDFIDLGRRENRQALREFAACKASGIWKRPDWGRLVPISAPRWALNHN